MVVEIEIIEPRPHILAGLAQSADALGKEFQRLHITVRAALIVIGAPVLDFPRRVFVRRVVLHPREDFAIALASGEFADGIQKYKGPETPIEVAIGSKSGAYVGFKQLDLTGVSAIMFAALAPEPQLAAVGGTVEVRLDSANGPLVGETAVIAPSATIGSPTMLRSRRL